MFSYVSLERRVPKDRALRIPFDERYSHTDGPSIPLEQLLRALLVQILFTIPSRLVRNPASVSGCGF